MFALRIFTVALLCLLSIAIPASAQSPARKPGSALGSGSTQPASVPERHGSAWTLSNPLGFHIPDDIDTLTYNYQRRSIPAMASDAWATTGNLGAEGIDMLFFGRPDHCDFFFDNSLSFWIPSLRKQRIYNVYVPTTIVQYNFAGGRLNKTDRLQADFAGNVNRRVGIGASMDYLYSKGCYENQATKDFSYALTAYYTGDRYEMQAMYQHFNFLNKENGGITDDLYITDPAVLQGGVDKIEAKSIPTRLSTAHSRLNGNQLFMTHAYKVGFWEDEQVNDTLTRQRYVPMTRFIYSLDYSGRHHLFRDTDPAKAREFWKNAYLNPSTTDDNTRMWQITNTFGIEMIEGFRKWAKFGLSAYVSLQNRRFTQTTWYAQPELTDEQWESLTPLPKECESLAPRVSQTRLWVGGRISKTKGSILRYNADARFGLAGDAVGDVAINGDISTHIPLFGDTVAFYADGRLLNLKPSFLLRNYVSNHFAWSNDFGKTRTVEAGARLQIPWTRTEIGARLANIQNYVYFNSLSLPSQHTGSLQVVSLSLSQKLTAGIWNWDNSIIWQLSSDSDINPLPALTVYSNMYLGFTAFRVLKLQIGVDCDYYTSYYGLDYQPATMTFHVQEKDSRVKVGNYPLLNAYATARLYKVRFYVLYSHMNQGWFSKNYFSLPHYPINPARLMLGLSVDFPN